VPDARETEMELQPEKGMRMGMAMEAN